jgi:class 3 adenylate cyclase
MRELSNGTVTFLFTDIEGSTDLLKDLGDSYKQVLMDHRRLLEEAFEEAGGRVVDTQGDAYFVAFRRAHDAVAAAAHGQRALSAHTWPSGAAPRVRMGIHTGEPAVVGEQFVGLSVHRAARICAAGHGGQVLISSTTRDLVEDRLPSGVKLLDLGEHRLKDIDRPERIAQLLIEGFPPVFTALKSLSDQPAAATRFAGQEEQLAAAAQAAIGPVPDRRPLLADHLKVALLKLGLRSKTLLRPRRSGPHALEAVGLRLHATARIAPDDVRPDLAKLGGAVAKAARAAADADRLLAESDRKTLSRQLHEYRELEPATELHIQAADAVARHLSAVVALQELRGKFEAQAMQLESRLTPLPGRIFQARLDRTIPADLVVEVRELRQAVDELASGLRNACDRLRHELASKRQPT